MRLTALTDAALKPIGIAALILLTVLQLLLTVLLLPRPSPWRSWPRPRPTRVALTTSGLLALLDAALWQIGSAVQIMDSLAVLQLLLTALLLKRRPS